MDDGIQLLTALFLPTLPLDCVDAADIDDDGILGIVDPILLLNFLFLPGSSPPAPPLDDCGLDPTPDDLDICYGHDACP